MTIIAITLAWLLINTWICLFIGTGKYSLIDRNDLLPIFWNTVFSYLFWWILRKIIKTYKRFRKGKKMKEGNKNVG